MNKAFEQPISGANPKAAFGIFVSQIKTTVWIITVGASDFRAIALYSIDDCAM
jgi:hypothetical protein